MIESEEHGMFVPCTDVGVYMAEEETYLGGDDDDSGGEEWRLQQTLNANYIDIQIVLNPVEFEIFAARRKGTRAELKHSQRFMNEKQRNASKVSLKSSTPYIDPKRIQKEIYRPAQPQKWIEPQGFKVTGTRGSHID